MKMRLASRRLQAIVARSPISTRTALLATEAFRGVREAGKSTNSDEIKILIIGGGSGGIAVSANLARTIGLEGIAVVDPSPVHSYQALWTFVGAGLKDLNESQRPMSDVIPSKVQWIQEKTVAIEPEFNRVVLDSGRKLRYEYLVVAPGIELKWNKISGLKEALGKNGVASNYSDKYVKKVWEFLKQTKEGNALFTMPSTPVKCAGAPQKIAYLAEDYFRKNNVRDKVNVGFYSGLGKLFAIEKYANELAKICKDRNIQTNFLHELVEVDGAKKVAIFQKQGADKKVEVPFSFLHVTPPMGAYDFIKESGLANPAGFVDVDHGTLIHNKYKNIFSLGDASSCPTSKTAAAVTAQTGVVTFNLLHTLEQVSKGTPLSSVKTNNFIKYDGYTSCPLLVGNSELILAEFSGYTGQPQETLPYDQAKPSRLSYFITSSIIPRLYWDGLLKGHWHGPSKLRKYFSH
ncbi:hypothetical protein DSO57_1038039 [Entomophthora muscae]|uniref:Uncharacterized protein n=1 Tax=Entomophthora muscae TaxID=34485 RepID=A0ACC2RDK1_9FUNG|nr:hypothetical protein DSO57_1038039 [Entomophthora muscae]